MLIEKGKAVQDTVKGKIFNIQHFCVDDGPGIRTTVFFKGCPLRCAWCHNPESQAYEYELMLRGDKCRECMLCTRVCESGAHEFIDGKHVINRSLCKVCGKCTEICPYKALDKIGREVSVEDIMPELTLENVFYKRSGGGVTLSGGEPLAQPEFALAILRACKEASLHTCIETCGFSSKDILTRIAPYVDLFLFDYKLTDDKLHKVYTGASNKVILENLSMLSRMGKSIVLRCPIIPNVNTNEEHYRAIARLADELDGIKEINLEAYHPLGINKAKFLGRESLYNNEEFLGKNEVNNIKEYISGLTSVDIRVM
ncbi:MAG: glycyl-radical enzyme activating protein [Clostridiales bacterium]|nr:glycyl-radical enzyme activating protein [Clostridiales bacterium]